MAKVPKVDTPCMDWRRKGKCNRGKACIFRHDDFQASNLLEGLEEDTLQAFETRQIEPAEDRVEISQYCTLASYNWTSSVEPTILIPGNTLYCISGDLCLIVSTGFAPQSVVPEELFSLEPDDLKFASEVREATVAYEPRFEPLVKAVKIQQPDYEFQDVHFVTGLNNIRQLYGLCAGRDEFSKDRFRIDVEVAGRTVYLSRWDSSANLALGSPCRGYGRGFEEQCTIKPDFERFHLTSYHRIVEYQFGTNKLVVQFECDASTGEEQSWPQSLDRGDLPQIPANSSLSMHVLGKLVSSTSLVEIKSKEAKNKSSLDRILAQLYFSGTCQLLLGRHSKGFFRPDNISLQDKTVDIQAWELQSQRQLRVFSRLLEDIRAAVLAQHDKTGCKKFALLAIKDIVSLRRRSGGMRIVPDEPEFVSSAE